MYLKSLEINGFKSFAKKGDLAFSSPITAIVGPNGSGKSNVAEAFRFVLGEQSIKSLRGKKGEDLIFNGSSEIPRANRAAVKVVFDNSRRTFNVDFDEVTIERVVHRDSVNQYFINGSAVRLKDIVELLAQAHIGASGHHIISQGEADRILSTNPRERREMIEDALGLKIYQYKRQESERKLEKTQENIRQVESLRREIAPHIKFLKKQVEKIEKAVELRNQLSALAKEYFKRESIYLAREKAALVAEESEPMTELRKLTAELDAAKAVLAAANKENAQQYEIIEIESQLAGIRSQHERLSRDSGRVEGEITSLERLIERKKRLATVDDQKTVLLKDIEAAVREIEVQSAAEADAQTADVNSLRALVKRIHEQLRAFITTHRGVVTVSVDAEQDEIKKLQEQKKGFDAEVHAIKAQEKTLQDRYLALKQEIEKAKDSNRDAERAVFTIMARQNEVRGTIGILKARGEKLGIEEANFKRTLGEAATLVGREVTDYAHFALVRADGSALTDADLAREPRSEQEERRRLMERLQIRLEDTGGGNGEETLKEFRETSERDVFLLREIEDLQKSAADLEQLIKELTERLDTEFTNGVKKINTQFNAFFQLMFGGGTAALELVVPEKPRRKKDADEDISGVLDDVVPEKEDAEIGPAGIEIQVALPHKKTKGLIMLSGGERALTSIALLFAISQVNPPPFIILDETDAALDEANSRKYGDMIANLADYSQLILITHNRETMSRAGVLYGVTMGAGGSSRLLSIQFDEAVKVAK